MSRDVFELEDEHLEAIVEHLDSVGAGDCEACGASTWSGDVMHRIPNVQYGPQELEGPNRLYIPLTCTRCGNTRLLSYGILPEGTIRVPGFPA